MWADLTKTLSQLPKLLSELITEEDEPIETRPLPHPSEVRMYALRGYRGPEILISDTKYPGAFKASQFVEAHVALMNQTMRVSPVFIKRDANALCALSASGPVRVVPAY